MELYPDVRFNVIRSVADDTPQSVNGIGLPDTPRCEWATNRHSLTRLHAERRQSNTRIDYASFTPTPLSVNGPPPRVPRLRSP